MPAGARPPPPRRLHPPSHGHTTTALWPPLRCTLRTQGKSKGCAFLTYENRTDADKAIHTLDGQVALPTDPRGRLLSVKFANSAAAAAAGSMAM